MNTKLTKKGIDSYKYDGGWDVRWDSMITGFGVRLYPSGKKSFVLSYRKGKRKRLLVLGQYGKITLDKARDLAQKRLAELVDGNDPAEQKKQLANEKTVRELCRVYMNKHAKPHKKSWKDDERRIKVFIIPDWGQRQVLSITKNDVSDLHHKIGLSRRYEANRTLALASKMFELAIDWGFLKETDANPAKRVKKFKESKRDRWVTPEEMPELARAINQENNLYAKNAIWLYLYTGVRKSELLQAKWEDVDLFENELRLPETKSGRTHYIHLSEPAIEILKKLPKEKGNPYIFPGKITGKHLINIEKSWRRIREQAGLDDVRLHDLRRTVGSWLAQSGKSLHLIGSILNHSNESTTAIYARFGKSSAIEALEDHGKRIKSAIDGSI